MKRFLFIIIVQLGFLPCNNAQCPESVKRIGEENFKLGQHQLALDAFLHCADYEPGNIDLSFKIGICYFHTYQLEKAKTELSNVAGQKGTNATMALYYLAKTQHWLFEFENAAKSYKSFLSQAKPGHPLWATVKDEIRRCDNGIQLRKKVAKALAVNLGEMVNSTANDIKPILNPAKPDCLFFTSNGRQGSNNPTDKPWNSKVFFTCLNEGDWMNATELNGLFVNSPENDIGVGFSANGSSLYLLRAKNMNSGNLLRLAIDTEFPELPAILLTPFNPRQGDLDPFFVNDSILLFSSNRPGGYGGYDIYISQKVNGFWSLPQNLGNDINSNYDELSPWLAQDGKTLYFSTNDILKSIGGLDIVKTQYLDKVGKWMLPENLGLDINSAGDEMDFFLNANNTKAFFTSSGRAGLGGKDIYAVFFDNAQLILSESSSPAFLSESFINKPIEPTPNNEMPLQSISFRPLLYSLPNGLSDPENLRDIRTLAQFIHQNPEAQVIVTGHCGKGDKFPDLPANQLRKFAGILSELNVPMKKFMFLNFGAQFPQSDKSADKLNKRIEIYVANSATLTTKVTYAESYRSGAGATFLKNLLNGLSYCIEFYGDPGISGAMFKKAEPNYIEEYLPGTDSNRLYSGYYLTFYAANEAFKNLVNNGIVQIRIVALAGGWPLTLEEAKSSIINYPDLHGFIENYR